MKGIERVIRDSGDKVPRIVPACAQGEKRECSYGRTSTPPVSGRGTPVVVGNVIGNPRRRRTAKIGEGLRLERIGRIQPTALAVSIVAGASRCAKHAHQRQILRAAAGDDPALPAATAARRRSRATAAAVIAVSVAAPSATLLLASSAFLRDPVAEIVAVERFRRLLREERMRQHARSPPSSSTCPRAAVAPPGSCGCPCARA